MNKSQRHVFDSIYAYRFIKLMQIPFVEWRAYELGLINEKGAIIRKPITKIEKEHFSPFHQAVRKVKRYTHYFPMLNHTNYLLHAYAQFADRYGITESILDEAIEKQKPL